MADDRFHAPEGSVEYERLFDAAHDGDIERLEAALLPSINVNALESDPLQGRAALHVAAQSGNITAIDFLLAHGAKVDLRNSEYETPLHEAVFWVRPEAVGALLDAGADINLRTGDYDFTALHNVLKYKHSVTPAQIETIQLLLDRGVNPNVKAASWGSTEGTLIEQACALDSIELVQILVGRGARLDNALLHAADNITMARFLLDRGAKIFSAPRQLSALTNAASAGNTEVVRLLISRANDAEFSSSRDALHSAAARGRIDVVKLLIEHGFDVNTRAEDPWVGATPLLATCQFRKATPDTLAVARLLIDHGADVNARSRDGTTAAELLTYRELELTGAVRIGYMGDKLVVHRL
ncbi:MAG: hypothetical protein Q9225_007423 [Loekoesia sp. 1 TL-2023]